MISFFVPCVPFKTTHHAKRIVRRGRFVGLADKPELVQARQTYESLLTPHRPASPLEGALRLELAFFFPFNKSHSAKFKATLRFKETKPDCSNLAKTFEDCLCRMGFFHDDGQVAQLVITKHFCSNPGISVYIGQL